MNVQLHKRSVLASVIPAAALLLAACGGGGTASPAASAPLSSAASKPAVASAPASVAASKPAASPAVSAAGSSAASVSAKPAASVPIASGSAAAKPSASGAPGASTEVKDASGKSIGSATFTDSPDGVIVNGTFQGLPAGPHGWHIHTVGKCEAPGFTTAGGHLNPTSKVHGAHNPDGFHAGDLGNIIFPASGSVTIKAIARGANLGTGPNGLLKSDGTALVLHAALDDDETDPAGNSGDRVACGVITAGAGSAGASAAAKPAASSAASASAAAKPAASTSPSAAAKPSA